MEKEFKNELRRFLTGRTIRDAEGWLIAVPEGNHLIYHGVADHTGHRRIVARTAVLQAAQDPETAFYRVFHALQHVGILANMRSQPQALCALRRYFLTKAVILCVFPEAEGKIRIQAYTGRSILAGVYCRHAIAKLKKHIAEEK